MTASYIAQEMGVSKVFINSSLSEFLAPFMFEDNPIPILEYNQCKDSSDLQQLYQKYLIPPTV